MSTIPPHYSDTYVDQRFRKAVHIVQHLSPQSAFQPTKDQKLELYALYKQAATGDVQSQRPGIFDVVGRAKWDAWKRLQGMDGMEAKHRYVEVLLKVAIEAYKKPASKAQAQQIVHALTLMRPGNQQIPEDAEETSSEDEDEDDDDNEDEDEDTSIDEEEEAYLRQVQRSRSSVVSNRSRMTPVRGDKLQQPSSRRASVQSTQSSTYRRVRTPSSLPAQQHHSLQQYNLQQQLQQQQQLRQQQQQQQQAHVPPSPARLLDDIDPNVNPWTTHPSVTKYKVDDGHSDMEAGTVSTVQLPSPVISTTSSVQRPRLHSPNPPESTASSVTATGPPSTAQPANPASLLTEQQYTSVVALGPATKRALDTLQSEIVALNNRIDGLRLELTRRNQARQNAVSSGTAAQGRDEKDAVKRNKATDLKETVRHFIRVAIKHAAANVLLTLFLLIALYRKRSPIAYVILDQLRQLLERIRFRLLSA